MANFTTNHRPPCSVNVNGSGFYSQSGIADTCYNHLISGESGLPRYTNVTKRIDYHDVVDPAGVEPYFRPHNNHPSDASCIPADSYCHGEQPDTPYCELPDYTTDQIACTFGDSSFNNGLFYNCFHRETGTIDLSACRKLGWKNVFGRKIWHGRWAYDSVNYMAYDNFDWCFQCASRSYTPTFDRTKYLTLSGVAHFENLSSATDPPTLYYGDATAYTSIGRYNGQPTASCSKSSFDPDGESGYFGNLAFELLVNGNKDVTSVQSAYSTALHGDTITAGLLTTLGQPETIAGAGTTWSLAWYQDMTFCDDSCTGCAVTHTEHKKIVELTISNGNSYTHDTWAQGICGVNDYYQSSHIEMSAIGTHFHHNFWGYGSTALDNSYFTATIDAYLSDPYTDSEVLGDITGMLGTWNLRDDVQYPWRIDGDLLKGPLVTYAEQLSSLSIPYCGGDDGLSGISPNPYYDGSMLGKPHPYNGAPYWDDRFELWERCKNEDDIDWTYYIRGYGGSSPFPSATQWTNYYDQTHWVQPFAFLNYDEPYLYAAKFAETQIQRPSVNYARPCGADRFQIGDGICIALIESGVVTLDDSGPAPAIETDDFCYVCGKGVWIVGKVSDYVFNLTSQIATETDLTRYNIKPIYDCGGGQMAKLRWNHEFIPPMCGPVDISNVSISPSGVTLVLSALPTALVSGDVIKARGNSTLNGLFEVTNVNGNRIMIVRDGMNTGNFLPYTGGGYIQSPEGADPYWNDDRSKNEFTYREWIFNNRDFGEYSRLLDVNAGLTGGASFICGTGSVPPCSPTTILSEPRPYQASHGMPQGVTEMTCTTTCLPFNVCYPNILMVTPNGEPHSGNRIQFAAIKQFPTDFPCDPLYGSEWQGKFEQMVKDPFWKDTPCKCVYNEDAATIERLPCFEDDGTCQEDDPEGTFTVYPHGPMVEARCEKPDGAPILVNGVYVGCLPLSALATTGTVNGNVCAPPNAITPQFLPWRLYLNELGCVCTSGRFDAEYIDNRVFCKDGKIISIS